MKKLTLAAIGMYLNMLAAFSQSTDTSAYKSPVLKLEEVNLVSGYYSQNGNHSAVTGGIGTQHLNDVSNTLELKFVKWNAQTNNKYTLDVEAGLDHHTAASQAYISKTGASNPGGSRFYPSVNWSVEKPNGSTLGGGIYYSAEYNYHSIGLNITGGIKSKDKATELQFKGQAFLDRVSLILPSELKTSNSQIITVTSGSRSYSYGGERGEHLPTSPRNTFSGALTVSHIVNKNLQFAVIAEPTYQEGFLGLPFHRVYFNNDSMKVENLPGQRVKLPAAVRMSFYPGDKLVFRTYYRYYQDNWGVKAHTASLELPYKLSPFVSIAPFYRYYTQEASTYFAPYKEHSPSDQYYTSNYDLSTFRSNLAGINFRFVPKTNEYIFSMIELRISHYNQTTGLHAFNAGLQLQFK